MSAVCWNAVCYHESIRGKVCTCGQMSWRSYVACTFDSPASADMLYEHTTSKGTLNLKVCVRLPLRSSLCMYFSTQFRQSSRLPPAVPRPPCNGLALLSRSEVSVCRILQPWRRGCGAKFRSFKLHDHATPIATDTASGIAGIIQTDDSIWFGLSGCFEIGPFVLASDMLRRTSTQHMIHSRNYAPVHCDTVHRALIMNWRGKATSRRRRKGGIRWSGPGMCAIHQSW